MTDDKKVLGNVEGAEFARWTLVEFCERLSMRLKGQLGGIDQEEIGKMVGAIDGDLARILSIVAIIEFLDDAQGRLREKPEKDSYVFLVQITESAIERIQKGAIPIRELLKL